MRLTTHVCELPSGELKIRFVDGTEPGFNLNHVDFGLRNGACLTKTVVESTRKRPGLKVCKHPLKNGKLRLELFFTRNYGEAAQAQASNVEGS